MVQHLTLLLDLCTLSEVLTLLLLASAHFLEDGWMLLLGIVAALKVSLAGIKTHGCDITGNPKKFLEERLSGLGSTIIESF